MSVSGSRSVDAGVSIHVPVMADEIVAWIAPVHPQVVVDGTFGGGGHSERLLRLLPPETGRLIALDRDPAVTRRVEAHAQDPRLSLYLGSYERVAEALKRSGHETADAAVFDLGLSSDQLADRDRGFSFQHDGPLDLRFDPEAGTPAFQWLRQHREKEIADAIYRFGEERNSRRIARMIVDRASDRRPVHTVGDLVEICRRCVRRGRNHDIHPATRTFQALRIVVNDELGTLQRTLASAPGWVSAGGRIAVISFHSLEDRIVKQALRSDPWRVLTRKPQRPREAEIRQNPRSRSAKLRVAERIDSRDRE